MTDIVVPVLGESVTEATIGRWLRNAGDNVSRDDVLVELETDKVAVEVAAPEDGVLSEILTPEGETVEIGALLARLEAGINAASTSAEAAPASPSSGPVSAPATPAPAEAAPTTHLEADRPVAPSVRRIAEENQINPANIPGTGKNGRATKADALNYIATIPETPASVAPQTARAILPSEERVKMTRLRQTIARRLKEAQNSAAMLTTFNDVDMSAVMAVRKEYKELFEKKHGVKLGFMSFFVRACVTALREIPAINAEIDGTDIIYKNYYNISVAVGTDKGLVVPVIRDADQMSLADIEKTIGDLGLKARKGDLTLADLQGGTFTISNGGVYGSMMSTPILNPPQSGVLGMHRIEQRPVVVNGQIEARPMMYLALSYDHRIVDGKEAVTFLVRVKECLEDPKRMLLDL